MSGSYPPGDGNYCVTCGSDKTVKLWNPNSGLLIKTYVGHGQEVLDADRYIVSRNIYRREIAQFFGTCTLFSFRDCMGTPLISAPLERKKCYDYDIFLVHRFLF